MFPFLCTQIISILSTIKFCYFYIVPNVLNEKRTLSKNVLFIVLNKIHHVTYLCINSKYQLIRWFNNFSLNIEKLMSVARVLNTESM